MKIYLFSAIGAAAGLSTEFLLNPIYRIASSTLRNQGFCYPCRKAFSYSVAGAIGSGIAVITYKLWSTGFANRSRTTPPRNSPVRDIGQSTTTPSAFQKELKELLGLAISGKYFYHTIVFKNSSNNSTLAFLKMDFKNHLCKVTPPKANKHDFMNAVRYALEESSFRYVESTDDLPAETHQLALGEISPFLFIEVYSENVFTSTVLDRNTPIFDCKLEDHPDQFFCFFPENRYEFPVNFQATPYSPISFSIEKTRPACNQYDVTIFHEQISQSYIESIIKDWLPKNSTIAWKNFEPTNSPSRSIRTFDLSDPKRVCLENQISCACSALRNKLWDAIYFTREGAPQFKLFFEENAIHCVPNKDSTLPKLPPTIKVGNSAALLLNGYLKDLRTKKGARIEMPASPSQET